MVLKRSLEGWQVKLEVSINGLRVHKSVAQKAERAAFEALAMRAFYEEQDRRQAALCEISGAVKALYGKGAL